jgi:hypothetical protein
MNFNQLELKIIDELLKYSDLFHKCAKESLKYKLNLTFENVVGIDSNITVTKDGKNYIDLFLVHLKFDINIKF